MVVLDWAAFLAGREGTPASAMTVGVFDGVHLGHMALVARIVHRSEELVPTVVSFTESPKALLRRQGYEGDIAGVQQKIRYLEAAGVRRIVLIDFSGDFSRMSGKEFIGLLRDRGNLRYLAVGSDFRCGHRLDTDALRLKAMNEAFGIPMDVVPPVSFRGAPISSSRIRSAIVAGDLVEAAALLGRNVELDLFGVPTTPGPDGIRCHARAAHRITPPRGRYPALLYGSDGSPARDTMVEVGDGFVVLPPGADVSRVEFLSEVARRV